MSANKKNKAVWQAPCALQPLPASPFERLNHLLEKIPAGQQPIDLSLGEPKHDIPAFVGPVLAKHIHDFRRYPPIRGTKELVTSLSNWLKQRYHLHETLDPAMILPLSGTREGLFYTLFAAKREKAYHTKGPFVFVPNPFYQTYAAAAQAAECTLVTAPQRQNGVDSGLPDFTSIDPNHLDNTIAVYLASPANPQGTCASEADWQALITLARRHDFLILADECYSEIYRSTPPTGILQAAHKTGSYENVLAFHSLSKRSNLAGLRFGFVAGDPEFIKKLALLRNMAAPQVPLPVQAVAKAAFEDETHVQQNRKLYNKKFDMAVTALSDFMPFQVPAGGFFLWLDCSPWMRGEDMAQHLWKQAGLKVVPGSYLAAEQYTEDGKTFNPADYKIRLALVDDLATTEAALTRLRNTLKTSHHHYSNVQTGKFHA